MIEESPRLAAAASEPVEPLPLILRSPVVLTIIAVLLVFYTLYFAAALIIPIAMALLLSMLVGPIVSWLERRRIPRGLAAALVTFSALGALVIGLMLLAGPAQYWLERAPDGVRRIEAGVRPLMRSLETLTKATEQFQDTGQVGAEKGPQRVQVVRPALTEVVLGTPQVVAPIISVFILLFLLTASGDAFLRKLVTIIPTFKDKKRAVEIIRAIEDDISYYLFSFAAMNLGLGIIMGLVTAFIGLPNPTLWGVVVAILNFVPFIGGLASMGILALVGLITFENTATALAAPAIMFVASAVASQVVTPLVLGRGLQLNPVAIFVAVMLWGWLWGILGVLLAVPLLACFKIICERFEPLQGFAEFITAYVPPAEPDTD